MDEPQHEFVDNEARNEHNHKSGFVSPSGPTNASIPSDTLYNMNHSVENLYTYKHYSDSSIDQSDSMEVQRFSSGSQSNESLGNEGRDEANQTLDFGVNSTIDVNSRPRKKRNIDTVYSDSLNDTSTSDDANPVVFCVKCNSGYFLDGIHFIASFLFKAFFHRGTYPQYTT
jgi:hypothetical protein